MAFKKKMAPGKMMQEPANEAAMDIPGQEGSAAEEKQDMGAMPMKKKKPKMDLAGLKALSKKMK